MKLGWKLIAKAELKDATTKRQYLGRNLDLRRVIDFIAQAGGFGGAVTQEDMADAIYADEPSDNQVGHERSKGTRQRNFGYHRLGNLWHKNNEKHITPPELAIFFQAFIKAVGPKWTTHFDQDELVTSSLEDLLKKAKALNLPLPISNYSPGLMLEIACLHKETGGLSIRPIDPHRDRLGGAKNSSNSKLVPAHGLPYHEAEESYVLQVRGLNPDQEQLFVLEYSYDEMYDADLDQLHCGFPVSLIQPQTANISIRQESGHPFVFYDIAGQFAFLAIAVPQSWDFQKKMQCETGSIRWTPDEFLIFKNALENLQRQHPEIIRTGWYGYRID